MGAPSGAEAIIAGAGRCGVWRPRSSGVLIYALAAID